MRLEHTLEYTNIAFFVFNQMYSCGLIYFLFFVFNGNILQFTLLLGISFK